MKDLVVGALFGELLFFALIGVLSISYEAPHTYKGVVCNS